MPSEVVFAVAGSWPDPYVVHRDPATGALDYFAHPKGKRQAAVPLAKTEHVAAVTAEPRGVLHAVIHDDERVLYITNRGGAPTRETLAEGKRDSVRAAIAADKGGGVHVVYRDNRTAGVQYWMRVDGEWSRASLARGADLGNHVDVDADGKGKPHILYASPKGLRYMTKQGGRWQRYHLANGPIAGCAVAVEDSDFVHVCYADIPKGMMMYATNRPARKRER